MMDEMTRLTELGEALSPDEIPMARLRARTSSRPRRRWVRPVVVAAAASAAVAAGAVVMTGGGGPQESPSIATVPAAYEVKKNADGTVTFTVHELRDLDGATGALNAAGIAGKVLVSTEDCTTEPNPADMVAVDSADMTDSDTVVVSSSMYPEGGGVLVAVTGDGQGNPRVVEFGYIDVNEIPTCVNLADYGVEPRPSYGVEPRPTR